MLNLSSLYGAYNGTGGTGGTGYTGSQGSTGGTGGIGITGGTGKTGATGNTGATGGTGHTGAQGATSDTGGTGGTGHTGAQGSTSGTGSQGSTGGTGAQGSTSGTGGTGAQGVAGTGTGSGGMAWSPISINTLAEINKGYLIDATTGDITLTLPANPAAGDSIGVCDAYYKATTNIITIARNGNNIEGASSDFIIDIEGAGLTFSYVNAIVGWKIVSEIPASSSGMSWSLISTNTLAEINKGYLINATSGNVTLTLPLDPVSGDSVGVCDAYKKATTNVITIARNTHNIESIAQDLTLNINGAGLTLSYVDAVVGWKIVSEISANQNVGLLWTPISSDTAATYNKGYLINATNNNVTLTLPPTPTVGNTIGVCDAYGKAVVNIITVDRNGKNIEGVAENLIFNVNGAALTLTYADETIGWKITSEIGNSLTPSTAYTGFKNRIINGDMRIDQRNSGAEVLLSSGTSIYTLDRANFQASVASKIKVQQVVDAPTGFIYSMKMTVASQYLPQVGDYFVTNQCLEGHNVADFLWGTSNALPVTISFWIKGSVPGTYSAALINNTGTRSYVFTYSVTSSWARQTMTVPGCTDGTWLKDNNLGLICRFELGSGSNYLGTAGSWQAVNHSQAVGSLQFVNQVVGSTLNITGIQLEKGSVATDFEFRSIGVEQTLCERYARWYPIECMFYNNNAGQLYFQTMCSWLSMRVAPSCSTPAADPNVASSTNNLTSIGPYKPRSYGCGVSFLATAGGTCSVEGYRMFLSAEL